MKDVWVTGQGAGLGGGRIASGIASTDGKGTDPRELGNSKSKPGRTKKSRRVGLFGQRTQRTVGEEAGAEGLNPAFEAREPPEPPRGPAGTPRMRGRAGP